LITFHYRSKVIYPVLKNHLMNYVVIVSVDAVNESLVYGTCIARQVTGRHMCYHPSTGAAWLRRHGLRESKAGCVEMSCAADYLQTRTTWGVGGLLLHELSHAFHDLGCPGGYSCDTISKVLNAADEHCNRLKYLYALL
jgi:hypothetical protein